MTPASTECSLSTEIHAADCRTLHSRRPLDTELLVHPNVSSFGSIDILPYLRARASQCLYKFSLGSSALICVLLAAHLPQRRRYFWTTNPIPTTRLKLHLAGFSKFAGRLDQAQFFCAVPNWTIYSIQHAALPEIIPGIVLIPTAGEVTSALSFARPRTSLTHQTLVRPPCAHE